MSTWTQEDFDTLKAAVKTGILKVTYSGPPTRAVEYQSLEAMRSLLAEMQQDINDDGGRPRRRLATYRKGV